MNYSDAQASSLFVMKIPWIAAICRERAKQVVIVEKSKRTQGHNDIGEK